MPEYPYNLAIHGGCGNLVQEKFSPEREEQYKEALNEPLKIGEAILANNGSSIEAVEAAIQAMEDSPLFNAGKGAVFTHNGDNEMDAAMMDGKTLEAGAMAGLNKVKNPISASKLVMKQTNHVLLIGGGAEQFAKEQGASIVDPEWFYTEKRWNQHLKAKAKDQQMLDHSAEDENYGTVGAVAMDVQGNLASGSSTGGITNKKHGRVGDSAIIGAGLYANNALAAISCTGEGEYFMRNATAQNVTALMAYKNFDLKSAANQSLEQIKNLGGQGGMVAIDQQGNIAMPFITNGMYRGSVKQGQAPFIAMFQ